MFGVPLVQEKGEIAYLFIQGSSRTKTDPRIAILQRIAPNLARKIGVATVGALDLLVKLNSRQLFVLDTLCKGGDDFDFIEAKLSLHGLKAFRRCPELITEVCGMEQLLEVASQIGNALDQKAREDLTQLRGQTAGQGLIWEHLRNPQTPIIVGRLLMGQPELVDIKANAQDDKDNFDQAMHWLHSQGFTNLLFLLSLKAMEVEVHGLEPLLEGNPTADLGMANLMCGLYTLILAMRIGNACPIRRVIIRNDSWEHRSPIYFSYAFDHNQTCHPVIYGVMNICRTALVSRTFFEEIAGSPFIINSPPVVEMVEA